METYFIINVSDIWICVYVAITWVLWVLVYFHLGNSDLKVSFPLITHITCNDIDNNVSL